MKKLTLFVMLLAMCTMIFAQDDMKPKKFENSTWHKVVLVKYKTGKTGEARKRIEKYEAAGQTAGTPGPETYWFVTGSYDMMLIWDMKDGPSELEWKWDAEGIKWWKAFVKQEGSEEAAEKIQDQYNSLVSGSTSHIVRQDN